LGFGWAGLVILPTLSHRLGQVGVERHLFGRIELVSTQMQIIAGLVVI
jgi:hypothetical protein